MREAERERERERESRKWYPVFWTYLWNEGMFGHRNTYIKHTFRRDSLTNGYFISEKKFTDKNLVLVHFWIHLVIRPSSLSTCALLEGIIGVVFVRSSLGVWILGLDPSDKICRNFAKMATMNLCPQSCDIAQALKLAWHYKNMDIGSDLPS